MNSCLIDFSNKLSLSNLAVLDTFVSWFQRFLKKQSFLGSCFLLSSVFFWNSSLYYVTSIVVTVVRERVKCVRLEWTPRNTRSFFTFDWGFIAAAALAKFFHSFLVHIFSPVLLHSDFSLDRRKSSSDFDFSDTSLSRLSLSTWAYRLIFINYQIKYFP